MTATAPARAVVAITTPNPIKPVIVTVLGLVIGALTLAQAYFGSGHIPSAAEVGGLLGGSGVTLGSVVGFLAHHLGVNKAMLARDAAAITTATALAPTTTPPPGG